MNKHDHDTCFTIEEYAAELEEWMTEQGPSAMLEELHLDETSTECVFWRYGYLRALQDLQNLVRERHSSSPCTPQFTSKLSH